jgi:hypothetical protein
MARKAKPTTKTVKSYRHPDAESPMRPEVGTQARFNKRQPPKTYRYDSSLSACLDYDEQNHARELGEWLLKQIEEAAEQCPANSGLRSQESVVKALISMMEPFKEACSIPPNVRVLLKSF